MMVVDPVVIVSPDPVAISPLFFGISASFAAIFPVESGSAGNSGSENGNSSIACPLRPQKPF